MIDRTIDPKLQREYDEIRRGVQLTLAIQLANDQGIKWYTAREEEKRKFWTAAEFDMRFDPYWERLDF